MCSDPDSKPPLEPGDPGSAIGHAIGLIAADGNRISAYQADASKPDRIGIIVLPDYHGLTGFYEELGLRFAEHGIDALVLDYYGRTAEPPPRNDSFDHLSHARRTTWAGIRQDVGAAAAHLRLRRQVRSLYSIGFCFGGRVSFLLGTLPELGMAGVIGFYGWPVGRSQNDMPAPAHEATRLEAPLLGIFGGSDEKIGADDVERFRQALSGTTAPHEIITYEGAPHSFFDRAHAAHAGAAADAWARVLRFVASHQGEPP